MASTVFDEIDVQRGDAIDDSDPRNGFERAPEALHLPMGYQAEYFPTLLPART